jgi:hypothetical protein
VAKWPLDKVYLNKSGNTLTKECEAHFNGFCLKCGYGNHAADACRIYDSKLVLTLCQICQRGFHDQCENRYALENKSGTNSKDRKGRSNQSNQVNQILDGFSGIVSKYSQQHPVYPVVPMPMGISSAWKSLIAKNLFNKKCLFYHVPQSSASSFSYRHN